MKIISEIHDVLGHRKITVYMFRNKMCPECYIVHTRTSYSIKNCHSNEKKIEKRGETSQ